MSFNFWGILLVLVVISVLFNELVAFVNKTTKGDHPLAAVEVVFGVFYTVGGAWLIDGNCIKLWTLLWCFVASGVPMIVGDVTRWLGRMGRIL